MTIYKYIAFGSLLVGLLNQANAQNYTYTDLGAGLGNFESTARAINNSGQVAGWYVDDRDGAIAVRWDSYKPTSLGSSGYPGAINSAGQIAGYSSTAIIWNGDIPTPLGTLGGTINVANGINDFGQVTGYSSDASSVVHAVKWAGQTISLLASLGGTESGGMAINNAGQVAGFSRTADDVYRATIWNGTTPTNLGTLGGHGSVALGINESGQVAGFSWTVGNLAQHAVFWDGNTLRDIGVLGGTNLDPIFGPPMSVALGLNDAGQVVGYSSGFSSNGFAVSHAFVWKSGSMIDLNSFLDGSTATAGWVLNDARGINDHGSIVGTAVNTITGERHAFVLAVPVPVPEPSTYAMLLAGLALLGVRAKQKPCRPSQFES